MDKPNSSHCEQNLGDSREKKTEQVVELLVSTHNDPHHIDADINMYA